ncbi:hypothetical protein Tco_0576748 [Tanacetum coccineum]
MIWMDRRSRKLRYATSNIWDEWGLAPRAADCRCQLAREIRDCAPTLIKEQLAKSEGALPRETEVNWQDAASLWYLVSRVKNGAVRGRTGNERYWALKNRSDVFVLEIRIGKMFDTSTHCMTMSEGDGVEENVLRMVKRFRKAVKTAVAYIASTQLWLEIEIRIDVEFHMESQKDYVKLVARAKVSRSLAPCSVIWLFSRVRCDDCVRFALVSAVSDSGLRACAMTRIEISDSWKFIVSYGVRPSKPSRLLVSFKEDEVVRNYLCLLADDNFSSTPEQHIPPSFCHLRSNRGGKSLYHVYSSVAWSIKFDNLRCNLLRIIGTFTNN